MYECWAEGGSSRHRFFRTDEGKITGRNRVLSFTRVVNHLPFCMAFTHFLYGTYPKLVSPFTRVIYHSKTKEITKKEQRNVVFLLF